jgi:hypothetical protein
MHWLLDRGREERGKRRSTGHIYDVLLHADDGEFGCCMLMMESLLFVCPLLQQGILCTSAGIVHCLVLATACTGVVASTCINMREAGWLD